jgi:hypothetical protein
MRSLIVASLSLLLAACATATSPGTPAPAPVATAAPDPVRPRPMPTLSPPVLPTAGFRIPEIMRGPGLDGVVREHAPGLLRQFGTPRLDLAEGDMRKLQWVGEACVLDIYLYPLRPDAQPVATWLEARRASDGAAVDLLLCMQALRRTGE